MSSDHSSRSPAHVDIEKPPVSRYAGHAPDRSGGAVHTSKCGPAAEVRSAHRNGWCLLAPPFPRTCGNMRHLWPLILEYQVDRGISQKRRNSIWNGMRGMQRIVRFTGLTRSWITKNLAVDHKPVPSCQECSCYWMGSASDGNGNASFVVSQFLKLVMRVGEEHIERKSKSFSE